MSYLNDVFYADPINNKMFKLTNDGLVGDPVLTGKSPCAIHVATNQIDIYVTNTDENTVSWYRNGDLQKVIRVGSKPHSICEDHLGNIWVSNYLSGTITKIVNGSVEKHVYVGSGPKGLCSDENGDIWVALFLDNCVVKVSSDLLLPTKIRTGRMPQAIRAGKNGLIWVACTFSNTVVKLNKGVMEKNIPVGTHPYDLVLDKEGAVYVSNFNSNTVSKIVNDKVVATIPVGNKPYALATNLDGDVYVYNSNANTINKIHENAIGGTIVTCYNPMGIGDATGFQAYYVHKYRHTGSGHSGGGGGSTTITMTDLDADLQAKINSIATKADKPVVDSDVTHDHPTYDTVKKAIDFLLYTPPKINSFTIDKTTAEKGSTVADVTLAWSVNKTMTRLEIDNGVGDVLGTATKTITGANLTSDTTYTLTAEDDKAATVTKAVSIKFLNSIYYGATTEEHTDDSTKILALEKSALATEKKLSYTFDCTGGKYITFAMPTTFGLSISDFKIGGLSNSAWDVETVNHTNASGHQEEYKVFRTHDKQNGSAILVEIA